MAKIELFSEGDIPSVPAVKRTAKDKQLYRKRIRQGLCLDRRWKTVDILSNGVKVLEPKNPKANLKLPEESHTPNSIYAIANKDGSGIKAIGVYGDDGKKLYEILRMIIKELNLIIMSGVMAALLEREKTMQSLSLLR